MKNIRLVAFLFYLTMICGLSHAQNIKLLNGVKFELPFLELRGGLELNPLVIKDSKYNYGVAFNSDHWYKAFPVVFKAGNLSTEGSLSRLNNPEFSQVASSTGLSNARTVSFFEVSLPQKDSFSKAQALFVQAGYKAQKLKKTDMNFFYDGKTPVGSFDLVYNPSKAFDIGFCFTGGVFQNERKESTAWFLEAPGFHSGKIFCWNAQISFLSKNYKTVLLANIYESPFGKFNSCWRWENQFLFKEAACIFDVFYNPVQNLITSSGKRLSPLLQLRYGCNFEAAGFTAGASSLLNINLHKNMHNLKNECGIKYSGKIYRGELILAATVNIQNISQEYKIDFPNASIQNSNSVALGEFKLELNPKLYFERGSSGKVDLRGVIGCNGRYDGAVKLDLKTQVEITRQKRKFSAGLGVQKQIKWFTLDFKIEFGI